MKPLLFFIFIFLASLAASAQVHMNVPSANLHRDTTRMKPRVHEGTGVLQTAELSGFDYDEFIRQRDSLNIAAEIDRFKNRLISIDSLIAINNSSKLEDNMLGFMITYWESGTIDSFAISLTNDGIFNESENFDAIVQELNLTQIQYALTHADYVDRRTGTLSHVQFDARQEFSRLMAQASLIGGPSYPDILLDYIHGLLRDHKDKLGITSETIYEDSFEPANLTLNQKVAMREKFITYVSSKL